MQYKQNGETDLEPCTDTHTWLFLLRAWLTASSICGEMNPTFEVEFMVKSRNCRQSPPINDE
jgi:hypothetical protein